MARSQWTDAGASQTSARQARRGAVVALSFSLAMAFGLAACTTPVHAPTQSTISTPSPSVSARPTPSSSPTWLPVRPDSTKSEGLDGAIATARFFLSLSPYIAQTGDLTEWRAMSHPDCRFCASLAGEVEKTHASGGRTVGGQVQILGVQQVEHNDDLTAAVVTVSATQAPSVDVSADGTESPAGEGGTYTMRVNTIRSAGAWLVRGVEPIREGP